MNTALALAFTDAAPTPAPSPVPCRARPRLYLASARHADGRVTTYDANVKRTDAENHSAELQYDASSNLTLEINARLFKTAHEYDQLNRRVKTTQDTGSDVSLAATPRGTSVTEFSHDKVGNRTEERLANGNRVQHVYDALNRPTSTSDNLGPVAQFAYDGNGNRTQETDANGNVTTKTYDALNRLTQADMPEARTVKIDYDLVGNKTQETDANGNITNFSHDALNRLTTVTDPLNGTVRYTYDAVGNKLTEQDKRGNTTRFEYDDLNRLTQTTDPLTQVVRFTYDLVGNKLTESDKRGTQTVHTHDKENRPLTTVKAGVTLSTIQYDELGQQKFVTDANGHIDTYIYDDGRGLMLLESRPLAAITRHRYDAIGNRLETRDPEGRLTTATYDARRRPLTETNGENQTTTHTYDGNGNRTSTKRPNGNTWAYAFDAANRLTQITDPLNGQTRYTHDKNSNRLTQVDAKGNTTSYAYDALNRQTAMTYADNAVASFRYDENGNRTGQTDPQGQVFTYVFDALNRETQKTYPLPAAPTGDDIQTIATQYDANGNPLRITETYSGATGSRVTVKSFDAFDRMTDVTDAFGKTLKYIYDANGNRTALTDPDNQVTRYTFDELNRVSTVTNAGGTTTYEYDRSSLNTKVTYPNGTTANNTYDRARRTTRIDNKQGAATVSSYAYAYDANGNRTQQVEVNGSAPETTTYAFDTTDRLTRVTYPDKTTNYTYDAAYNRLTETTVNNATSATEVNKTYSYNNRNQLTAMSDAVSSANNVAYNFDANGNQTQKTQNGIVTTFIYDVRDQLIAVRENATTLGFFFYDYQGLRVSKDLGGQIVRYTYDDQSVLTQTDNQGQTIAKYDYGTDRLLSMTHATEGRQFYLFDALGSVANLTTPAGAIQARYQYDAFGNQRAQAGSSYNRFTFTGHEKDTETNLFYFKARFYDPDTGRFLNQDPYLGDINTPPSLHRYLYAYSNPTVYIDLTGYQSTCYGDAGGCERMQEPEQLEDSSREIPTEEDVRASIREQRERLNETTPKRDPFVVDRETAAQQREIDRRKKDEVITVENDQGSVSTRRVDDEFAQGTPGQQQLRRANEVGRKVAEVGEEGAEILTPVPGVGAAVGIVRRVGKGAGNIIKREVDNAALASKKGAVVTDAARTAAPRVRDALPPLERWQAREFEEVRTRTFKKGDRVHRSPREGESIDDPGRWFGTRETATREGTDSMYQLSKPGVKNPMKNLRTYEFTEDVTVYYGKVKDGTGHQLLFPSDTRSGAVLKHVSEKPLK